MTTKRKKKATMNAVDKYILQKRYSLGKKSDENKKPVNKVIKVVVPKLTEPENYTRRSARSVPVKVELAKNGEIKKVRELKPENSSTKTPQNNLATKSSRKCIATSQSAVQKIFEAEKQNESKQKRKDCEDQTEQIGKKQDENLKGRKSARNVTNQRFGGKPTRDSKKPENANKTARYVLRRKYNDENCLELTGRRKNLSESKCSLPKRKRKVTITEPEVVDVSDSDSDKEPCCSYVQVPLNCEDKNTDTEVTEEVTPITKKYQPYMERLKLLTSDAIQKFIKENQQYYVNFQKEVESKMTNVSTLNKKMRRHDEMRDSFKCNPFSSDKQLVMYYTLREIFNIPRSHFKECRNLFTVLIPEISCQLFAETFRIKVSFAPRLIKKLYPNPVCPV